MSSITKQIILFSKKANFHLGDDINGNFFESLERKLGEMLD